MNKIRIDLVAGARPNFMKIAPIYHRMVDASSTFEPRIIHTGQHNVGSGHVVEQTARVMEAYERELKKSRPDLCMVVGDVNSTIGCAMSAAHYSVPVIHLEAGLRSFDRTMPEEINRILTDRISDLLLVPSEDAIVNLRREGAEESRIKFVGNIMIDALEKHRQQFEASDILSQLKLDKQTYGLVTLHRPGNVDDHDVLSDLLLTLVELSTRLPIMVSTHPRLQNNLDTLDTRIVSQIKQADNLHFIDPLGYVDFMALQSRARVVLTDSGGIQEESTVLGIPCLTLRENTERPITIHEGTNRLVGRGRQKILVAFDEVMALPMPAPLQPRYWDGQTAGRVVDAVAEFFRASNGLAGRPATAHVVKSFCLPHVAAHRSPEVRRELLYVAESGSWQNDNDTERLADRVASYVDAARVVLCADVTAGFGTLRAHYTGRVAVLGNSVPDDIAAALNGSAAGWSSLTDPLPADAQMVYVPPVSLDTWELYSPDDVAAAAARYPGVPFVVDDRWFEYTGSTISEWLHRVDNLIILRSLGPAFGLDGLGAGYMLGSGRVLPEGVARASESALLPVTRRAAMVALLDQGYMREYVQSRLSTRKWVAESLNRAGLVATELPGPHVFVRGECPECLRGGSYTLASQNGWLWAIGTPDQVEDQLELLQTELSNAHS
jgi:UDP-N-acetylglucosamine 2-epimerase (non-hydrolysing)